MKKIFIIVTLCIISGLSLSAQPRSAGIRTGATGFELTYLHSLDRNFVEADLGVDFGHCSDGQAGFKATALYNFVFARPAWTNKGTWALYAGPGLSLGYVEDKVPYEVEGMKFRYRDYGFMLAVVAQVGIEYSFSFPLQLALDIRPYFGLHFNDGIRNDALHDYNFRGKTGYYDNGWMHFIPSLSVRYRF